MQKLKSNIIFPLVRFVMKTKHHTKFIIPNKLLKSILISYYYEIIKKSYYVLIKDFDIFMTNKTNMFKIIFVNIAYHASLAQKY